MIDTCHPDSLLSDDTQTLTEVSMSRFFCWLLTRHHPAKPGHFCRCKRVLSYEVVRGRRTQS